MCILTNFLAINLLKNKKRYEYFRLMPDGGSRSISLKVVFGKTQADGQCPKGQSCLMSGTAKSKAITT
jgi:hypothetical protein